MELIRRFQDVTEYLEQALFNTRLHFVHEGILKAKVYYGKLGEGAPINDIMYGTGKEVMVSERETFEDFDGNIGEINPIMLPEKCYQIEILEFENFPISANNYQKIIGKVFPSAPFDVIDNITTFYSSEDMSKCIPMILRKLTKNIKKEDKKTFQKNKKFMSHHLINNGIPIIQNVRGKTLLYTSGDELTKEFFAFYTVDGISMIKNLKFEIVDKPSFYFYQLTNHSLNDKLMSYPGNFDLQSRFLQFSILERETFKKLVIKEMFDVEENFYGIGTLKKVLNRSQIGCLAFVNKLLSTLLLVPNRMQLFVDKNKKYTNSKNKAYSILYKIVTDYVSTVPKFRISKVTFQYEEYVCETKTLNPHFTPLYVCEKPPPINQALIDYNVRSTAKAMDLSQIEPKLLKGIYGAKLVHPMEKTMGEWRYIIGEDSIILVSEMHPGVIFRDLPLSIGFKELMYQTAIFRKTSLNINDYLLTKDEVKWVEKNIIVKKVGFDRIPLFVTAYLAKQKIPRYRHNSSQRFIELILMNIDKLEKKGKQEGKTVVKITSEQENEELNRIMMEGNDHNVMRLANEVNRCSVTKKKGSSLAIKVDKADGKRVSLEKCLEHLETRTRKRKEKVNGKDYKGKKKGSNDIVDKRISNFLFKGDKIMKRKQNMIDANEVSCRRFMQKRNKKLYRRKMRGDADIAGVPWHAISKNTPYKYFDRGKVKVGRRPLDLSFNGELDSKILIKNEYKKYFDIIKLLNQVKLRTKLTFENFEKLKEIKSKSRVYNKFNSEFHKILEITKREFLTLMIFI